MDKGGLVEQAALGGVGRLLLGLAALALEGLEQDRLLAQHVGPLEAADRHVDRVPGTQDVLAQEVRLLGRLDRALEHGHKPRVLAADDEDRLRGADGVGRDHEALDDEVRVGGEQRLVDADRRVGAVAVGDHVALDGAGLGDRAPLVGGGVAGAAAAAQPGGPDGRHRGGAAIADGLAQALERARLDGGVQVGRVGLERLHAAGEDRGRAGLGGEEGGHQLALPP